MPFNSKKTQRYFCFILPACLLILVSGCQQNNANADLAKKVEELEKKIEENKRNVPTDTTGNTTIPPPQPPVIEPKVDTVFVDKPCLTDSIEIRSRISVHPSKMNVFYIGVENPIHIDGEFSASDHRVTGTGAGISLKKSGSKQYNVTVNKPGEGTINVKANGVNTKYNFRAKRLPNPVARISNSTGGSMGSGEFKAQGGVAAFIDNFDFDVRCQIQGYNLIYIAKRQDPVESINQGPRYNAKSSRLIKNAKPGDTYLFTNIKAKCPGDTAGRRINTIAIRIQ